MRKTILIPTDFEVESLNTLKLALKNMHDCRVEVVLMHACQLSTSITELLFYSPDETIETLMKPAFREGLAIIRNKFPQVIAGVRVRLFHGNNNNAFTNFTEGLKVDEIYVPQNYTLKLNSQAFDPLPFIRKSKLPVYEMAWDTNVITYKVDQLGALFTT